MNCWWIVRFTTERRSVFCACTDHFLSIPLIYSLSIYDNLWFNWTTSTDWFEVIVMFEGGKKLVKFSNTGIDFYVLCSCEPESMKHMKLLRAYAWQPFSSGGLELYNQSIPITNYHAEHQESHIELHPLYASELLGQCIQSGNTCYALNWVNWNTLLLGYGRCIIIVGVMGDTLWDRWEIHCGRNISTLWWGVGTLWEKGGALCESNEIHCGRDGRNIMGEIWDTLWERWDIYIYCGSDWRYTVQNMGDTSWEIWEIQKYIVRGMRDTLWDQYLHLTVYILVL